VAGELDLMPVPGGTRPRLRVKPGAKKNAIVGAHGGALKLSVAAPPERGKANRAVVELLANALGLPSSAVTIATGETSQDKVAEIAMSSSKIRERLAALALALLALTSLACTSKGYEPGLGELMSLQQMRHEKLWRAGEAGNWELAAYELDELGEGFDDVVRFHPTHKDSPLPLSDIVPKIMGQPLRSARSAVDAHDPQAFAMAFDAVTAACNSCHQATNFGFNVVHRPPDSAWYANQDFAPHR
jgi:uncharacterized protein (TIGR00251 family)